MRRSTVLGPVVSVVAALMAPALSTPLRVGAQTTPIGNPLSYAISGWIDYSATSKPHEGFYGEVLRDGCPNAAALDTALSAADDVGVNGTVGDRTGRIVGRVHTRDLGPKSAKAIAALDDPGCLAYAGDTVVSGTLSQYTARPDAPIFGVAATDAGGVTRLDFNGVGSTGPFAGTLLAATAGNVVNTAAVRIANPQPGELDSIVTNLAPTVRYGAAVASVPAPSARQFGALADWAPAGDQAYLEALQATFTDATPTAAPRTTAPAYPDGCDDAFDAFVNAGQRSALGGTQFTGGGGQVQVRVTPQVFANPKDAKKYARHFDDLTACTQAVFTAGAGGQTVQPVTRTPATGQAKKSGECTVLYSADVGSPPVGSLVFGVQLVPDQPRALTITGRFAATAEGRQIATELCAALASAYGGKA